MIKAHEICLYLPSALVNLNLVPCDPELQNYEWRLREGQAFDALDEIRHNLQLRAHSYKFKDKNIRGVRRNMRSNKGIDKLNKKIALAAKTYRAAWKALQNLDTVGRKGWENDLKPLREQDIRAMSEGLYGDSESHRTLSWIWVTQGVAVGASEDASLNECESFQNVCMRKNKNYMQRSVSNGARIEPG